MSKNHRDLNDSNVPTGTVTTTSYEYNNSEWQDLLTKYGNDSITYDTIGNPLNYRSGMTMTWSGRDLTSITKSGDTYSYTYNINGYRTKKIANGNTYYYYYDSDNKLIGMQTGVHTYVFYYDNEGKIHSMEENGDYYYFVKNAEGDVIAITNHHGTPIVKYTYDAWGKTTSVKDNNGQDISTTSYYAKTIPFRFRGYAYDNESGLYYLNSRYYDPETGRFINADSYVDTESGTPSSTNMFAYCENNPVMGYDPEGTWDYKLHRKISNGEADKKHQKSYFSKRKYDLACDINYCTDFYPLGSNDYYSAPFHSRSNALKELAKYLFNESVNNRYNKTSKTNYSMEDSSSNFNILKYIDKKNINITKDAQDEFERLLTLDYGTFDFLKNEINNNVVSSKVMYTLDLSNYPERKKNRQSNVLLGLALHTFQDYYSHLTNVKVVSVEKKRIRILIKLAG